MSKMEAKHLLISCAIIFTWTSLQTGLEVRSSSCIYNHTPGPPFIHSSYQQRVSTNTLFQLLGAQKSRPKLKGGQKRLSAFFLLFFVQNFVSASFSNTFKYFQTLHKLQARSTTQDLFSWPSQHPQAQPSKTVKSCSTCLLGEIEPDFSSHWLHIQELPW